MPTAEPRIFRPMAHWQPAGTKLEFHPAAEQYPMMREADINAMAEDMKANGYDSRFPIGMLEDKIGDGRNRYTAAIRAGVEFLTTPLPKGTDPEEYVQRANEHRRHLSPEWMHAKRLERIERVAAARTEGHSLRTIAAEEDVSLATVVGDLETAVVQGRTTQPPSGKVTGKNGRQQPAKRTAKAKQPVLPTGSPWNYNEFDDAISTLLQQIDLLGKEFKAAKSDEARALREELADWKVGFKVWHKSLKATKKKS